jgi:Nucleotide modification associated domain 3
MEDRRHELEAIVKIILSRKGFDSGYGKVPSPILPDGRMISLPIPDKDAPTTYNSIKRDEINIGDMVADLTSRRKKPISPHYFAHLDPDLDQHAVPRPDGWRPIFGQSGAALGHLTKQAVGPGDLFLFFGWFQPVEQVDGHWRYVHGSGSFHALWGWMQIGKIHPVIALPTDVVRWAEGHPHVHGVRPKNNSVIVATDEFVLGGKRVPGAGIFTARPNRVLTVPGENRSIWRMPAWMRPDAGVAVMSYHGDAERWAPENDQTCRLRVVDKGQEFVLSVTQHDQLNMWLVMLFADIPTV